MLLWYMRTLGYVSILSKSTFIDDAVNIRTVDKRLMSEEQIVVFRPPFLMSQVELRYVNCCGRISRALTVDHVIPFKAAVFDMCRSGDINGLRDAYYAGSVSLEVVDPLGMGLLHVSVAARPYHHHLTVNSMRRVAFRKTYVLGFSEWVSVLIVRVGRESMYLYLSHDILLTAWLARHLLTWECDPVSIKLAPPQRT